MNKANSKTVSIFRTIIFVLLVGIGLFAAYKNHQTEQAHIQENFIQIEAEITRAGRTGNRNLTKSMLWVTYRYNDQSYSGTITRPYQKDGYYKTGGTITININPNKPKEIK